MSPPDASINKAEAVPESNPTTYDAFLCHASEPDFELVRSTKVFLETFHEQVLLQEELRPLKICVDGIDFKRPHERADDDLPERSGLQRLLAEYLQLSKWLVVFGSSKASNPEGWVQWEVEEFIRQRNGDTSRVLLVVSFPYSDPLELEGQFPPAVIGRGLHRDTWFNFQGLRESSWLVVAGEARRSRVRSLEARASLGAQLHDESAGNLLPSWRNARRQRRRRSQFLAAVLVLLLAGIAGGVYFWFDAFDARSIAGEHLARIGHANPALPEDWASLATLSTSPEDIRVAALERAFTDTAIARRVLDRTDALARALVGFDERLRAQSMVQAELVLEQVPPAPAPNRELAIAFLLAVDCHDTTLLDKAADAWQRAVRQEPDSSTLQALGPRLARRLSATSAVATARFVIEEFPQKLPPAAGPSLAPLARKSLPAAQRELRERLLERLLQDEDSTSNGWLASAIRACSPSDEELLPWIAKLRKELRILGDVEEYEEYLVERSLRSILDAAVQSLGPEDADVIWRSLLDEITENPERMGQIGPLLARALFNLEDGHAAASALKRLASIWTEEWNLDDRHARRELSKALVHLADLAPPEQIEPLWLALLTAMTDEYERVDPGWATHHVAGLRPPLALLATRLDRPRLLELLRFTLAIPLTPSASHADRWPPVDDADIAHARQELLLILDELVAHAPIQSHEILILALHSGKATTGREIARGVRAWQPTRAASLLQEAVEASSEKPSEALVYALPGLVTRAGESSPISVLNTLQVWFDSADDGQLAVRYLADALASHPKLQPEAAELIRSRMLAIRDTVPDSFSGHLVRSSLEDRAESVEPRLATDVRHKLLRQRLDQGTWPSASLVTDLDGKCAEEIWSELLDAFEDAVDGPPSRNGDQLYYLGHQKIATLLALARCLPADAIRTQLQELSLKLQQNLKDALPRELEPVLLALVERTPDDQATETARRMLAILHRSWTTEGRTVMGRALAQLLRDANDNVLIEVLRDPAATGVVERAILGQRDPWSLGSSAVDRASKNNNGWKISRKSVKPGNPR